MLWRMSWVHSCRHCAGVFTWNTSPIAFCKMSLQCVHFPTRFIRRCSLDPFKCGRLSKHQRNLACCTEGPQSKREVAATCDDVFVSVANAARILEVRGKASCAIHVRGPCSFCSSAHCPPALAQSIPCAGNIVFEHHDLAQELVVHCTTLEIFRH